MRCSARRCPDRTEAWFRERRGVPAPQRALVGFELGDAAQSVVGARVAGNKKGPPQLYSCGGYLQFFARS